jgi:hypothetical protein
MNREVMALITLYCIDSRHVSNWSLVSRWHETYITEKIEIMMNQIRIDISHRCLLFRRMVFQKPNEYQPKLISFHQIVPIVTPFSLWLLTQCRKKLMCLYGWQMDLFEKEFPWQETSSIDTLNDFLILTVLKPVKLPCENQQSIQLPYDCITAITTLAIEAPEFTDISAYYAWFATCRSLRQRFLTKSYGSFFEKSRVMYRQCEERFEARFCKEFSMMIHACRIECCMEKLIQFKDCQIHVLTNIIEANHLYHAKYTLWLLIQCYHRINARHNREFILSRDDIIYKFPWKIVSDLGLAHMTIKFV